MRFFMKEMIRTPFAVRISVFKMSDARPRPVPVEAAGKARQQDTQRDGCRHPHGVAESLSRGDWTSVHSRLAPPSKGLIASASVAAILLASPAFGNASSSPMT